MTTDIRPPAVAGAFYEATAERLRAEIEACFTETLGPGDVPVVGTGPRQLLGIVAPHAGYLYSGAAAAWAYAAAARDGRPTAVVILGVNHRGVGAPLALSPAAGWRTPLGVMPVAQQLNERLLKLDSDLRLDPTAHAMEHSLEVQVPFLQYTFGEVPIVPIVIGHVAGTAIERLGAALAHLATQVDLLVVASSDLSHYIPQQQAATLDALALKHIAEVDAEGLLDIVLGKGITMCGVLPTAAMLHAARKSGATHGKVLHYHTSGDVSGDLERVVGYGAAAIYRKNSK